MEEWKWIPGFEGQYKASTYGRIKSFKKSTDGLIMTGTSTKDGRIRVNLNGKKYLVHRLVLLTFKPQGQKTSDNIVLHIDGNPANNHLNNLKWGTYKENAQDLIAVNRNLQTQLLSKERREQEQYRIIPNERWADIPNYEGEYQISDYGRVKSFKNKKPHIMSLVLQTTSDYYTVGLCKKGKKVKFSIDRLVAQAFVANPNNYTEVNHIDEDTLNNYYKNLEWCSHSQNVQHSIYRQSIPVIQCDLQGNEIAVFKSIAEASRKVGATRCGIANVLKGSQKTAGGYKWKKQVKGEDVDGAQSE